MVIGTRTVALLLTWTVGFGLAVTPPAHAQSKAGKKCQKLVDKQVAKFVDTRVGKKQKLNKCLNKAVKKGTETSACLTSGKTAGKIKIKSNKCTPEALLEIGLLTRTVDGEPTGTCADYNPACTDASYNTITDSDTLSACLVCALTNSSDCVAAIEYGVTKSDCFVPPGDS